MDDGEFFGNRIEQGQSIVRAHPNVVSLVDVDGGDFLARQRIRVSRVWHEIPDFAGVDGQDTQTIEDMTDIKFSVQIVRHTPDVVAHHARYGGHVEVFEDLRFFVQQVHPKVIGANPKPVFGSRLNVGDVVGDDGIGIRGVVCVISEFLGFGVESVQAGTLGGYPDGVVRTVRIDLIQFVAVDAPPLLANLAVNPETVTVEPVQPRFRSEPHVTLLVLCDADNVTVGQSLFHAQLLNRIAFSENHQGAKEKEKCKFRFHRQAFKVHPRLQN